jgi:hypothetical protein
MTYPERDHRDRTFPSPHLRLVKDEDVETSRYAVDVRRLDGAPLRLRLVVAADDETQAAEIAVGVSELRRGGRFAETRIRRLPDPGPVDA